MQQAPRIGNGIPVETQRPAYSCLTSRPAILIGLWDSGRCVHDLLNEIACLRPTHRWVWSSLLLRSVDCFGNLWIQPVAAQAVVVAACKSTLCNSRRSGDYRHVEIDRQAPNTAKPWPKKCPQAGVCADLTLCRIQIWKLYQIWQRRRFPLPTINSTFRLLGYGSMAYLYVSACQMFSSCPHKIFLAVSGFIWSSL